MTRSSDFIGRAATSAVLTALAALAMVAAAQTRADPPAAEAAQDPIDTVTVEARKQRELLERQISTYVSEIARHSRAEALARWALPICPLVAGLTFEGGKFVFERISRIAKDAGIPLGPVDCQPNLLVVMTHDPEELLKQWWSDKPRLFNTERGIQPIERTIRTPAPVRVIYNACSIPSSLSRTMGRHVLEHCNQGGALGSRLKWSTTRAIYSVIVVVDKRDTQTFEPESLADYVGMISLARIRSDAELGAAPTILRLFEAAPQDRPQQLSAWDRAFLASLYATDSANTMQVSEIKERMKQDLVR
jgi:hypothetical protein